MKARKLAIIGAGNRGCGLARLAVRSGQPVEIAGLVEPDAATLHAAADEFHVLASSCFTCHESLLESAVDFDAAIVATDVRTHARIACDCLNAGLPIYLEKPMTRTINEAIEVYATARSTRVPLVVGFNLRFAPFYKRLKELISAGAVGQIISIEWKEVLSAAAWADGYCRSTWYSRKKDVGGWLLEKSCHDIDQINWLAGAPCERVASFGSRRYFVPREDVPQRCTDGCPIESRCYFSCFKLHPDGPASLPHYVPAEHWDLCVYHSGSDLVDRQVAILEYENGVTAAFSLLPIGNHWERLMRICGSEATIRGSDHRNEIHIYPHDRAEPIVEDPPQSGGGHGGADPQIVSAFLRFLDDPSQSFEITVEAGLESMLSAGGIEMAREQNQLVELGNFREGSRGIDLENSTHGS